MRAAQRAGWPIDERMAMLGLAGIVTVLSLLPLLRLGIEAFTQAGGLSSAPVRRAFGDPLTWQATRNSLEVAVAGTLLAMTLGTVVALVVSLTDMRWRNAFVFVFVIPLMIAPQVTALAWLQITGPASPLLKMLGLAPPIGTRNPLYSREGIIMLLGVQYAPFAFLTLRAGLRHLPRELTEAALSAGATPLEVLRTVILPLMSPSLIGGAALTFVSCIGNFGIPAFLGIPGKFVVLPTLIYQRLSGLGPSVLSEVSVLSLLVGAIACAGILLQDRMTNGRDYRITTASLAFSPFALGRWRSLLEIGVWTFALAVLVLPIVGLVMTSLVPAHGVPLTMKTATLSSYEYVLFEHAGARRALFNSITLAATAAALIVVIAIPLGYFSIIRRSRLLSAATVAAELPYALPGVVLAIALILLFLKPIPLLGLTLYNTAWIILLAYLARFLVLGLRPILVGCQQLDRGLEEAAQVAGAGLVRRLSDIVAPLVAPAAAAGFLLIFLTAFNELTVSALLWSSGAETLGIVLFSFEQGGDSNFAAAVAVMTVLLTLALMASTLALSDRLPKGALPWRD